ncbi:MAG: phosphoribosylamine--glycine ligase [Candidatus Microthrix sp.]|uniref:Phosphoribosylamine--glycine ligase n=1 Tax=Candidatus Neomicrothrix subdominans TaxID=2954438 RepID=A0A936NBM4_9ACTN|nr:phosphoribosylamine--glycine ligase [Candidatus Microthrix subdominans]MBK9561166.1 phosphoribosylamine--glycine ligase [Candidatus Microthrix sp.]
MHNGTVRVCVVGSGGREAALADVLGRDATEVLVSPGNPLIEGSVDIPPEDLDADLFVIGPEAPLVDGLADRLRAEGQLVFGPGVDGAQLEGSKAYMKGLLAEAGVPTARYGTFTEAAPARAFLDTMAPPFVIKTDGLAAGKGVLVTDDLAEARNTVDDYLSGRAFGDAGQTLVIEEGLVGPEVSVFAVCDGRRGVLLSPAQDFKRIGDGDTGPNTGGMGAFSPYLPEGDLAAGELERIVADDFIAPTLAALRGRGIDFRGVLYAGLMLTSDGPKLLEYNVRFGDPETQVVLPRMTSSLVELLAQAAAGSIEAQPTFSDEAMVNVVCASEGYPASPRTGDRIDGLAAARALPGVNVYGAGVASDDDGALITSGGRVLSVCGRGVDVVEARERAYAGVAELRWRGMTVRTDIASTAART